MQGITQGRYPPAAAIGGHDVLAQVVGPDAHEVDVPCQTLCDERRSRDLNHDAELHPVVKGNILILQFPLGPCEVPPGLPDLIRR